MMRNWLLRHCISMTQRHHVVTQRTDGTASEPSWVKLLLLISTLARENVS